MGRNYGGDYGTVHWPEYWCQNCNEFVEGLGHFVLYPNHKQGLPEDEDL